MFRLSTAIKKVEDDFLNISRDLANNSLVYAKITIFFLSKSLMILFDVKDYVKYNFIR